MCEGVTSMGVMRDEVTSGHRPAVVVTRPRGKAEPLAALLEAAGYAVVRFPTIAIRPAEETSALRRVRQTWPEYDWVVFTSAHAVEIVLAEREIASPLPGLPPRGRGRPRSDKSRKPRLAAIGAKTAQALRARGLAPDLVAETYTAEALVAALGEVRGQRILFPAADIARPTLRRGLEAAGGQVEQVTVYHTRPAAPDPTGLAALRRGVAWLTFTSPSTARNFVALVEGAGLQPLSLPGDPRVACIGPTTAEAVRELGFRVAAVARPHTAEGLAAAIRAADGLPAP